MRYLFEGILFADALQKVRIAKATQTFLSKVSELKTPNNVAGI
ncbi:hypothetical protein M23134_00995 [Microscilla marina ATCC 23134]|uniref:Uncharacterized protein n=1 Tax=Microscilla marina ATCC 23134 TaxID=313606 RepID=A1ZZH5_MICM2|nr:hypothetical protein M23134_00995 [Microscilla marina ATCC 23134]